MNRLTSPTYDYSLVSIPVAFGLSLMPHAWSVYRLHTASGGRFTNALPRESINNLKQHVPENVWKMCRRAQSASANSLEVFPLYVAAILGGKLAGLPATEINRMALRFLGVRTLYSLLYVNHTTEFGGYMRSLVYAVSIALPSWLLLRAGQVLNGGV